MSNETVVKKSRDNGFVVIIFPFSVILPNMFNLIIVLMF